MGTIRFAPGEADDFSSTGFVHDDPPGRLLRKIFGGPTELELFEVYKPPNVANPPHAHAEDEIIYVLEGSIWFGKNELGPGSAVFVPAWTLYSFRTGDDGARFTNFRARTSERAFITKEEFMAEREQHPGSHARSEE